MRCVGSRVFFRTRTSSYRILLASLSPIRAYCACGRGDNISALPAHSRPPLLRRLCYTPPNSSRTHRCYSSSRNLSSRHLLQRKQMEPSATLPSSSLPQVVREAADAIKGGDARASVLEGLRALSALATLSAKKSREKKKMREMNRGDHNNNNNSVNEAINATDDDFAFMVRCSGVVPYLLKILDTRGDDPELQAETARTVGSLLEISGTRRRPISNNGSGNGQGKEDVKPQEMEEEEEGECVLEAVAAAPDSAVVWLRSGVKGCRRVGARVVCRLAGRSAEVRRALVAAGAVAALTDMCKVNSGGGGGGDSVTLSTGQESRVNHLRLHCDSHPGATDTSSVGRKRRRGRSLAVGGGGGNNDTPRAVADAVGGLALLCCCVPLCDDELLCLALPAVISLCRHQNLPARCAACNTVTDLMRFRPNARAAAAALAAGAGTQVPLLLLPLLRSPDTAQVFAALQMTVSTARAAPDLIPALLTPAPPERALHPSRLRVRGRNTNGKGDRVATNETPTSTTTAASDGRSGLAAPVTEEEGEEATSSSSSSSSSSGGDGGGGLVAHLCMLAYNRVDMGTYSSNAIRVLSTEWARARGGPQTPHKQGQAQAQATPHTANVSGDASSSSSDQAKHTAIVAADLFAGRLLPDLLACLRAPRPRSPHDASVYACERPCIGGQRKDGKQRRRGSGRTNASGSSEVVSAEELHRRLRCGAARVVGLLAAEGAAQRDALLSAEGNTQTRGVGAVANAASASLPQPQQRKSLIETLLLLSRGHKPVSTGAQGSNSSGSNNGDDTAAEHKPQPQRVTSAHTNDNEEGEEKGDATPADAADNDGDVDEDDDDDYYYGKDEEVSEAASVALERLCRCRLLGSTTDTTANNNNNNNKSSDDDDSDDESSDSTDYADTEEEEEESRRRAPPPPRPRPNGELAAAAAAVLPSPDACRAAVAAAARLCHHHDANVAAAANRCVQALSSASAF